MPLHSAGMLNDMLDRNDPRHYECQGEFANTGIRLNIENPADPAAGTVVTGAAPNHFPPETFASAFFAASAKASFRAGR